MVSITLRVNGAVREAEVAADTPLLWVLRDALGLVGTKYGCGIGQCGACTVHLDGQPLRSCQTPVSALGTRELTTIEGLDPAGAHPLQRAWCELDVAQCGYCQAGMLMAAAALLKRRPRPSDADIETALAGHLCRCGTWLRIRAGIHRAAALAEPAAPSGRSP